MAKNFHTLLPETSGFCVLDSHELRIWALLQSTLEEKKNLMPYNEIIWRSSYSESLYLYIY